MHKIKRRLPPLNAIIYFEAVARSGNFTVAADALCVTPSAISHQIKMLEDWIGCKLFKRTTRKIQLTDAGRRYLLTISESLGNIESATKIEIEQAQKNTIIKLQTTDSFAAYWIIPKLPHFNKHYPDIIIQVITYDYREDFRQDEADIAILYKKENTKKDIAYKLVEEQIFPVCSADFFTQYSKKNNPQMLLIHDDNLGIDWAEWLSVAAHELEQKITIDTTSGSRFNHSHLALKAAEKGHGFTLASSTLIANSMVEKKLISPFSTKIKTGYGYYVFQSKESKTNESCNVFMKWLESQ